MSARIFSLVTLWLLVALALCFGKIHGGLVLLILFSTAAHYEFCGLLRRSGGNPNTLVSVLSGAIVLAGLGLSALDGGASAVQRPDAWLIALPGLLIGAVTLVLLLASPAKLVAFFTTAPTTLSWLYIPCGMAPLVLLAADIWARGAGGDLSGILLVVWLIATVKFADCGALLVGTAIGKHKLAPAISPAKTWEGCAGALLAAAAVGAGLAWVFAHFQGKLGWTMAEFTPARAALLAVPLAVLGILSDLVESVFKRKAGVKDSGKTIPGIGGAFDLLDSLLLTSPVAYVLLKYFFIR
jgi:phosphatidate cytidylyltransferase